MRKFAWFHQPYGAPLAKTWDSDLPTPSDMVGGTLVDLGMEDGRSLDELKREYPCLKQE